MDIKKVKQDRFVFLHKVYELVEGRTGYVLDGWEVGKELNFEKEYTTNIYYYLNEEGLVEAMGSGIRLAITHSGIKEIEEALSEPNKGTEHFLPINQYNINIGVMNGGAIQQATKNSTINYVNSIEIINEINNFTKELKNFISNSNLSNEEIEELQTDIQTIEIQSNSKKPKKEILKTSLTSIKTILEGVVAGVSTNVITANSETIIQKVTHLLSLMTN
jgi:hypothetical protein